MKNPILNTIKLAAVGATLVGSAVTSSAIAYNSFSINFIVDNDFALFSGTSSGVNNLLYQNDNIFLNGAQGAQESGVTLNLPVGDTTFYLLAMGGGGPESAGGTINGTALTAGSVNASMSSDLGSYLTDFSNQNDWYGGHQGVGYGTYSASLTDVQTAFSHLTWGAPTLGDLGFSFTTSTAHLFKFDAASVLTPVPEPAEWAGVSMALLGLVYAAKRRYASAQA